MNDSKVWIINKRFLIIAGLVFIFLVFIVSLCLSISLLLANLIVGR
jgi:hypothetical protein